MKYKIKHAKSLCPKCKKLNTLSTTVKENKVIIICLNCSYEKK